MDKILKLFEESVLLQIIAWLVGLVVLVKFIVEILKVSKVINLEDKNLAEALYSALFKKSYLVRRARKMIQHNNYLEAGKIYEEIGDYKDALNAYETGELWDTLGELYELRSGDGTDLGPDMFDQGSPQFIRAFYSAHRCDVGVNSLALDLMRSTDYRCFRNIRMGDQG